MELTFRSNVFELCVRTAKTYSIAAEKFLPPAINMRVGRLFTWSTGRGFRKFGVQ